ncbi:hypothetical protein J22TS3_46580 [Paenibacillus sp. J22TS3]|nr:hypothetical protein J22TS3_46580 [Paenibacillus sp. J22TS3]
MVPKRPLDLRKQTIRTFPSFIVRDDRMRFHLSNSGKNYGQTEHSLLECILIECYYLREARKLWIIPVCVLFLSFFRL